MVVSSLVFLMPHISHIWSWKGDNLEIPMGTHKKCPNRSLLSLQPKDQERGKLARQNFQTVTTWLQSNSTEKIMAYCHLHYQRPSGETGLPPLQGVWILAPGMSKRGLQEAETFTPSDHHPDPHSVSDDHTVKTTLLPLPGSKCSHPPWVKGDLVGNPNSSLHLAGIRQHPFLCPTKATSAKPSKIKD